MLTLFHAPKSRSSRMIWLLEELGQPYEIKTVGIQRGDGSGSADAANPHPLGKVPALRHDGVTLFESVAIAQYLTDAFPQNGIGPQVGDPKRAAYLVALAYYTGVLEPAFMSKFMNLTPPRGSAGWVVAEEAMEWVMAQLNAGPYFLGEKFSAADVIYGSTFALFIGNPLLPETPVLRAYIDRLAARPAYKRAAEKDG